MDQLPAALTFLLIVLIVAAYAQHKGYWEGWK